MELWVFCSRPTVWQEAIVRFDTLGWNQVESDTQNIDESDNWEEENDGR